LSHSIFISRNLKTNNSLLNGLTKAGWFVHANSLIKIVPLEFDISELHFDWLFLSSTNGAKLLFENFKPSNLIKIGAVGEATANSIRNFGFEPEFIGQSGDMNEVGRQFAMVVGNEKVLFAGAEGGSAKVRSSLDSGQVLFKAIYRTELLNNITIPETEFVYLTSPSNSEAFLSRNSLDGKKIVAIGQTTADFLTKKGFKDVLVPRSPKEEDVLELLLGF